MSLADIISWLEGMPADRPFDYGGRTEPVVCQWFSLFAQPHVRFSTYGEALQKARALNG